MQGDAANGQLQRSMRIGCANLIGREYDLMVFDDHGRLVMVFPPDSWAAFTLPQVRQLCTALATLAGDK